ncbi:50S ribosomal protein L24 [Syntrophomonas wolfei]|uniref:Large ribosomal subunit protein uL24 n=1 Tax=Syntrophomonas wolfei subsp. wolfei (strain DSM 2245B / Goettingen) TaxID=335541 RepID=RL24_SYNWW|nr:50S ribosomal protein L24 [Syntrophomonas wolfei]Q0AUJ1.1 RecName: Full=Large ribosomal subunit protein uL24; AltName: Full=50S ribosomal protein L24 [Syntrophomonas wolfei subsp. wolfei str. Goettingen G311]ABI69613.1 LSU ribosomal protein L24P [Syntrophomonas wolfei subsp. wolfei str. Goettingen G311]
MRIKKGDSVLVTTGKDAGKKGKVLRVIPDKNRVVIEGVNRVKKHQKPSRSLPQGGILKIETPLNASNVMLVCSRCNKPTRIAHKIMENGEKVRICKQCGEALD